MTDNIVPTFETERLILRPITLDDADAYEKHFATWEIIKNLSKKVSWPYPKGITYNYIKNDILPKQGQGKWSWAICLKETPDELIGRIDIKDDKDDLGNRGFWIGKEYWGKGYMTEALNPVMDFSFESLGFDRLVCTNGLGNEKSRRVKEKTGARLLRVRDMELHGFSQIEVWEFTKEEWFKFRNSSANTASPRTNHISPT